MDQARDISFHTVAHEISHLYGAEDKLPGVFNGEDIYGYEDCHIVANDPARVITGVRQIAADCLAFFIQDQYCSILGECKTAITYSTT